MKNLLRFVFFGELGPNFKIRVTKVRDTDTELVSPPQPEPLEKFKLVQLMSRILGLAFIVCLALSAFMALRGNPIPDLFIIVVSGVMGYFGGVISVYFGIRAK
jgi:hypothetical protein